MLFLSAYSAFAFYALIGQVPAFTLLAMIAIVAAALADREASLPLALMAVCGGFVTPFLVSGGGDAQILLFFLRTPCSSQPRSTWRIAGDGRG